MSPSNGGKGRQEGEAGDIDAVGRGLLLLSKRDGPSAIAPGKGSPACHEICSNN